MNSSKIAEQIEALYPQLKEAEYKHEACRGALEDHLRGFRSRRFVEDGLILQMRRKSRSEWVDEDAFRELLYDKGLLPLAVSAGPEIAAAVDLSEHRLPVEHSLALAAKRRKREEKERKDEEMGLLRLRLASGTVEEAVGAFRANKAMLLLFQTKYDSLKERLLRALQKEKISRIETAIGAFRIQEKDPRYDERALFSQGAAQKLRFACRELEGGRVDCRDLTAGESFVLNGPTPRGESVYSYQYGCLHINGSPLVPSQEGVEIDGERFEEFQAESRLSGEEAMSFCRLSATKVEQLLERGLLEPLEVATHKQSIITGEYFEAIEEQDDEARKAAFVR